MSDAFFRLFDAPGEPSPPTEPWDRVWDAHMRASPVRARIKARSPEGWSAEVFGLPALLRHQGAPAVWADAPPDEVEAYVLRFDRDRGVIELLAWSPRTGPGG